MAKYDSLTKKELLRLMEACGRREVTRCGVVWETDGIEAEQALNGDDVPLDLAPELCCGPPPWRHFVIGGGSAAASLRLYIVGRRTAFFPNAGAIR